MDTLSPENTKSSPVLPIDVRPEDVIVTWLLKRFDELPLESRNDLVSLTAEMTSPNTSREDRIEIYKTIREILFPHLVGEVQLTQSDSLEPVPDKLKRRMDYVGNKVKQLREAKGFTQNKLAEKSGLQQPQISRLEAGVHSPSFKTLEKIAKALGVTEGDLDPSN